jgi:hypothetical protein
MKVEWHSQSSKVTRDVIALTIITPNPTTIDKHEIFMLFMSVLSALLQLDRPRAKVKKSSE